MDILELKTNFDDKLRKIILLLKFKNNKISIKGTASFKSQRYFSDYDLFSSIVYEYTPKQIYDEIVRIINNIDTTDDLFFIELKIQNANGKKTKFYNSDIDEKKFIKKLEPLDFLKIDLIARIDNRFIEISIIYNFTTSANDEPSFISSIKEDITTLTKEGKFYKVLKRYFSLYQRNKDKSILLKLSKFFNSEFGALYQHSSNLKAIRLLLENYDDDITKRKVIINLKDINEVPDIQIIDKRVKDIDKIINEVAKKTVTTLGLHT